jgi:hypothetical protein
VARIRVGPRLFALVDWADVEALSRFDWRAQHIDEKVYVYRTNGDQKVYLHMAVMDPPEGMCVDHINGNPLDNRRANLRVCTETENTRNRATRSSNTGFIGVHFAYRFGRKKSHLAYITADKKRHHLGCFLTAEEAAAVHDRAALFYHGEFASLNFPERRAEYNDTPWIPRAKI